MTMQDMSVREESRLPASEEDDAFDVDIRINARANEEMHEHVGSVATCGQGSGCTQCCATQGQGSACTQCCP